MDSNLLIGNDMILSLSNLQDNSGNLITSATLSVTGYESDGVTTIGNVGWPLSFTYSGTPGTFTLVLPYDASITEQQVYLFEVTGTDSGSKHYEDWIAARAVRNMQ